MSEPETYPPDQIVGVDYGTVRIGLALGDRRTGLVVPLPVMPHPGSEAEVVERIVAVVEAHEATRIIIGDPLHMSGESSPMSLVVARLAEGLRAAMDGVCVELADERLTSADAESQLHAAGLRWWQYDKGQVDAMSAMTLVRDRLATLDPGRAISSAPPEPEPEPEDRNDRRARRRRARRRGR